MESILPLTLNIVDRAEILATELHAVQKHNGVRPYIFHLREVMSKAQEQSTYITDGEEENVFAAALLYSALRDSHVSYNDIRKHFNSTVADLVYAFQTERGRTVEERENAKYFEEMRSLPMAVFLRICVEIVEARFAVETMNETKHRLLCDGYGRLMENLSNPEYPDAVAELERLLKLKHFYTGAGSGYQTE